MKSIDFKKHTSELDARRELINAGARSPALPASLNSKRAAIEAAMHENLQLIAIPGYDARSHFGGCPKMNTDWPTTSDGRMLDFVASLSLSEMRQPSLPATGQLLFFYDNERQPWGYDPTDADGWQVIYEPTPVTLSRRDREESFPHCAIAQRKRRLPLPPQYRTAEALELTDAQAEAYWDYCKDAYPAEAHQLLGLPNPLQGPPHLTCQLAANGIANGNNQWQSDAKARTLAETAQDDWQLLLQVSSDELLDFCWASEGTLYFMIPRKALAAREFDAVWLELQCL